MTNLLRAVPVVLAATWVGGAGCTNDKEMKVGDQGNGAGAAARKDVSGQCFCGQVKYRTTGPIKDMNHCRCRGCQRANGTLAVPWVVVPGRSLTVTGELSRVRSDAYPKDSCDGRGGERAFCAKCGTQLFWYGDRRKDVDICAGTLDDTSIFQPKGGS